jgi:hypothetical protein
MAASIKKPCRCCDRGEEASLTRFGYGRNLADTLCPDNGGNSGAG